VLCNREIKFGVFREYARRLGGDLLATGHYARNGIVNGHGALFKGRDPYKDQSYFLHAVSAEALAETIFPLGELYKEDVRRIARDRGLVVHDKKDSTGICFIGERPFRDFLATYLPAKPGPMRTPGGDVVGEHEGLMYYTLGQRQGLHIGGIHGRPELPWYVVGKDVVGNALIVAQGEHELLYSDGLVASDAHWIGEVPAELRDELRCAAKVRYRQPDQVCTVRALEDGRLDVRFDERQRAVAPGQFVVFYSGEQCLGGAVIDTIR
jgi:tRNA-specific 2-thiouridylase